jgi:hypothetical protein
MNKFNYCLSLVLLLSSCGGGEQNNIETASESKAFDSSIKDFTKYVEPTKELLIGQFNPSETNGFSKVPDEMCSKPMYVQTEVLSVFVKMREAAAKDGINLYIVSGTRTFNDQKAIWERKWNSLISTNKDSMAVANEILKFSSMPGTSRHHWGTDIDLVSVDPAYFESEAGDRIYKWLILHAHEYGFCQVYSNKEETGRSGYSMEKWHWSYMPISTLYLKAYVEQIQYSDLIGFVGDNIPERLEIKQKYVSGIDSRCTNF